MRGVTGLSCVWMSPSFLHTKLKWQQQMVWWNLRRPSISGKLKTHTDFQRERERLHVWSWDMSWIIEGNPHPRHTFTEEPHLDTEATLMGTSHALSLAFRARTKWGPAYSLIWKQQFRVSCLPAKRKRIHSHVGMVGRSPFWKWAIRVWAWVQLCRTPIHQNRAHVGMKNAQLLYVIWAISNHESHSKRWHKYRKILKPFRPTALFQKMKWPLLLPLKRSKAG